MQRIQYHRYGGPEELRLEDVERPSPAKGEVLVRVVAASANPMDWGFRRGDAKLFTGSRFPRGLGHDFAGVVEAVGPGVDAFNAGDEVLGATDPLVGSRLLPPTLALVLAGAAAAGWTWLTLVLFRRTLAGRPLPGYFAKFASPSFEVTSPAQ